MDRTLWPLTRSLVAAAIAPVVGSIVTANPPQLVTETKAERSRRLKRERDARYRARKAQNKALELVIERGHPQLV